MRLAASAALAAMMAPVGMPVRLAACAVSGALLAVRALCPVGSPPGLFVVIGLAAMSGPRVMAAGVVTFAVVVMAVNDAPGKQQGAGGQRRGRNHEDCLFHAFLQSQLLFVRKRRCLLEIARAGWPARAPCGLPPMTAKLPARVRKTASVQSGLLQCVNMSQICQCSRFLSQIVSSTVIARPGYRI